MLLLICGSLSAISLCTVDFETPNFFAAFLTDIILFWILNSLCSAGVLLSTVIARAVSSAVNFLLNKKLVFKSGESAVKSAAKYYALAIPVMFISAFGVTALARLLGLAPNSVWVTILKAVVDTILFILNYRIQKIWVFKK